MMKTACNTTLLAPSFGRRIIEKYQKRNRIFHSFPVIVFRKNSGQANSQTFYPGIRLDWSLHLYNQNQRLISPAITNNVFHIKPLPRWLKSEPLIREHTIMTIFQQKNDSKDGRFAKYGPGFRFQFTLLKIHTKSFPVFSFRQVKQEPDIFTSPAFVPANHPLNPVFNRGNIRGLLNHFEYANYPSTAFAPVSHSLNPAFNRGNAPGRLSRFQNINPVSPVFVPAHQQFNPVFNRETGRGSLNYFQVVKASETVNINRIPVNFYFQEQHNNLQREFTEIKKLVSETKKTINEPLEMNQTTHNSGIKPQIDVQRISDRVYQEIERRIRTERERRGL